MKFSVVAIAATFASVASADWDIYLGTCDTGFQGSSSWGADSVSTYTQGPCKGYSIVAGDVSSEFQTQNPCKPSEILIYKPNGPQWRNVYVKGKENVQIGVCTSNDTGNWKACNGWNFASLLNPVFADKIRSLFRLKNLMVSNTTALTTSAFNTLLIHGIGVLRNGDIMYFPSTTPGSKNVLITSKGAYVGDTALAAKVRSFKPGGGVNRVEISMDAQHIQSLMTSPGPGSDTLVYRNFRALKDAWALDAVNSHGDTVYDVVCKERCKELSDFVS